MTTRNTRRPLTPSVLACTIAAAGLAACGETVSSSDIRTPGIALLADVVAERDDAARVTTTLVVGGDESNTDVVLEGGDALYAHTQTVRQRMFASDGGQYTAVLPYPVGADRVFRVALEREMDATAPNSWGQLPMPFLLEDLRGLTFARSEPMVIAWTPDTAGDRMFFDFRGACIAPMSLETADTGSLVVAAGTLIDEHVRLVTTRDGEPGPACVVRVTATRWRVGETDPGLDPESRLTLSQVRSTEFTSLP